MPAGARFLSQDRASHRRRYWRAYRRSARAASASPKKRTSTPTAGSSSSRRSTSKSSAGLSAPGPADGRPGNRHKAFPCCGRRLQQCTCEYSLVDRCVNKRKFNDLVKGLQRAALLNVWDTDDVSHFIRTFCKRVPGRTFCVAPHEKVSNAKFNNFVYRALVFRRYSSQSTWTSLQDAIPSSGRPQWRMLKTRISRICNTGHLFGGKFYPAILKHFKVGKAWKAAPVPAAKRAMLSCKLLWLSIPDNECEAYAKYPGRETFGKFYDALHSSVPALASGIWGPYSTKCFLDCLVMSGAVVSENLSRWPWQCPTYREEVARLFPGLPAYHTLKALTWIHMEFSRLQLNGGRLMFPESVMQLCWHKRRVNASLDDQLLSSQ